LAISWTPSAAAAEWYDNAFNFFTGDLATFLATADLEDMSYFDLSSLGITAVTGLELLVDTEDIVLTNNSLTELPALPDTGNLVGIDCQTNQIASIVNFPSSLTLIALGANLLTTIPTIPALVTTLALSQNPFAAATVNTIIGDLVANGLNNGQLFLVGLDTSLSGANITTLQGRGWTVFT